MQNKIKIRKATMHDFDNLLKLKLESKKEERKLNKDLQPINKVKSSYAYYLRKDLEGKYRVVFIAIVNKNIIGMIISRIYRSLKTMGYERRASMGNLFVKKEYRGKGIAKKLFNRLIKWANTNKVKRITLSVYHEKEPIKEMYHRLGFKEYSLSMHKKL